MPDPHVVDLTASAREAFATAGSTFVETVSRVADDAWDVPALGEWNVRDLVGHTTRAFTTVEAYLDAHASAAEIVGPVGYFVAVLEHADHAAVATRGREAGQALGADPLAAVERIRAHVEDRLAHTDDETLVATPAGGMLLLDYLPTRTFELTVHTLDLARAIDGEVTIDPLALASSLALVAGLAGRRPDGASVLLALTGRGALPDAYSVL
jgi:uncharacterized protein (TIGR03083 family)